MTRISNKKDYIDNIEVCKLLKSLENALEKEDGFEISVLLHKLKLDHNLKLSIEKESLQ